MTSPGNPSCGWLWVRVGATVRTFEPTRPLVVGRLDGADVVVDDGTVSRRHGELRPESWGWAFHDLGSRNGTHLDGRRVTHVRVDNRVTLRLGDPNGAAELELAPVAGPASPPPAEPVGRRAGSAQFSWPAPSLHGFKGRYRTGDSPVTIGRAADNAVVVADMLVSRHHAHLRRVNGAYEIVDLSSHNGTYVDGRRVPQATLTADSVVRIGDRTFRLVGGTLEEYVEEGGVTFDVVDLSVQVGSGLVILDGVSFPLEAKTFLAVLGPTGAGKSTLMKALTGFQPATRGVVLYNGRDLYDRYDELRSRIGYVPQDDILHPQLALRQALDFAAELRFPPDTTAHERRGRVTDVMHELGLEHRADVPIHTLAGGQRKRTSVAIELLTKPSLLFLDEPTTGLDPGYEKSVMELLRTLARGGRTVIAITHSVQSLAVCDRVLFLARGGVTAYYGPPAGALPYFGANEYADVFRQLDSETSSADEWTRRFRAHPDFDTYVNAPLARRESASRSGARRGGASIIGSQAPPPPTQLRILIRRYLAVIAADRRNSALLLAQAPLIAVLIFLLVPADALTTSSHRAPTMLVALVLGVSFMGESNAIREIVKELPIYRRERAVGLSVGSYLASKAIVLGAITVAQAAVLVLVGTLRQGLTPGARIELFLIVAATGLAAMALGLLISALVSNPDKALTLLPVLLLAQFLLSGGMQELPAGLNQLSYVTDTRWGLAAAASSIDLLELPGGCKSSTPSPNRPCDPLWDAGPAGVVAELMVLAGLTALALLLAGAAVRRRDPLRGRQRSLGP